MENNFLVLCPEIMKPLVTIFWFRENSWEPTFISFNVQKHVVKHTFKLKNITVRLLTKLSNVY